MALAVAALLATLAAAEGTARLLEPALPEPRLYADETTQVKVHQMDALGCADVVVAGNSMARDAFDPVRFTAADPSGRRGYNASLDAASPALLRSWLLDEVVPRLDPALVVVALASLDVNADGPASRAALAAYQDAELTGSGPADALAEWAVSTSALVRSRRELRDPAVLASAARRWWDGTPAPRRDAGSLADVIGPLGEGRSRRTLTYRHDPATRAFTRQQLLAGWTLDPAQLAALQELADGLAARGTQLAIVVLPVTDDYVDLHPRGDADVAAFRQAVTDTAASAGVPLVDLHDERPPTSGGPDLAFADTHHLNATGQAWFSGALPSLLPPEAAPTRCS